MAKSKTRARWVGIACVLLGCSQQRVGAPSDGADASQLSDAFDAGRQPPLVTTGSTSPPPPAAPGSPGGAASVPADFMRADIGGYKLGPALTPDSDLPANAQPSEPSRCSTMTAIVRDFRGARESNPHPDFEVFDGKKPTVGLLDSELGDERKPRYASRCETNFDKSACPYGQMTTSAAAFGEWYRTASGVNLAFLLYLAFEPNGDVYTFASKSFFPLDNTGFGNAGGKMKHNFGFTTELHGSFTYRGGEEFAFTGDDDLWVFINGRLAIDLGGLHPPATGKLVLDAARAELGIEPGRDYTFDLFHAERHSASSNFRVDTTIAFSDCGAVTVELL